MGCPGSLVDPRSDTKDAKDAKDREAVRGWGNVSRETICHAGIFGLASVSDMAGLEFAEVASANWLSSATARLRAMMI
jgi:hypothetical protein